MLIDAEIQKNTTHTKEACHFLWTKQLIDTTNNICIIDSNQLGAPLI